MAAKDEERSPLPPYIPFKTFLGLVQRLKETAVPERIDLSLLRNYSGSTARQIIAALKYLELIEEGGRTKPKLEQLVKAYDTENWQDTLTHAILEPCSDMLGNLKLDVATPAQLEERFRAAGADGQVLQMCVRFFIAAVTNAGVKLSPHIVNRPRAKPDRSKAKSKKCEKGTRDWNDDLDPGWEGDPDSDLEDKTTQIQGRAGKVKFAIPIPGKGTAMLIIPEDLAEEDCRMIDAMIRAYVKRKAGK